MIHESHQRFSMCVCVCVKVKKKIYTSRPFLVFPIGFFPLQSHTQASFCPLLLYTLSSTFPSFNSTPPLSRFPIKIPYPPIYNSISYDDDTFKRKPTGWLAATGSNAAVSPEGGKRERAFLCSLI